MSAIVFNIQIRPIWNKKLIKVNMQLQHTTHYVKSLNFNWNIKMSDVHIKKLTSTFCKHLMISCYRWKVGMQMSNRWTHKKDKKNQPLTMNKEDFNWNIVMNDDHLKNWSVLSATTWWAAVVYKELEYTRITDRNIRNMMRMSHLHQRWWKLKGRRKVLRFVM